MLTQVRIPALNAVVRLVAFSGLSPRLTPVHDR